MTFTGILPPLLFGLLFVLVAVWMYRLGYRAVTAVPAITGILLAGTTLAVFLQARNATQLDYDTERLLTGLADAELYAGTGLREPEETLFLFSTASLALDRARTALPEREAAIDSALLRMARWTARPDHLTQWRRGSDWDREVFFLAHAGAVIGHFQLATADERYAEQFRRIGRHLGERLSRGHYKHLGSHPDEDLLRPADNAAAIYALRLYDKYYGEVRATASRQQWVAYIDRELHFAESRLPCAGFTVTNRCSLEPSAAATGLYVAYRAASAEQREPDDIPYREWLHYFKRFSGNPFGLTIRTNMRQGQVTRLCDTGLDPLPCGKYEQSIGLWAAAEYEGGYTYFRLFCGRVFRRWFGQEADLGQLRPAARVRRLTDLALATVAEGKGVE